MTIEFYEKSYNKTKLLENQHINHQQDIESENKEEEDKIFKEMSNNNNLSNGVRSNLYDGKDEAPKKGFWSRLFGN